MIAYFDTTHPLVIVTNQTCPIILSGNFNQELQGAERVGMY